MARSLRALADELDESPATLSAILRGDRRGFSQASLNRIRGKLGLPPLPEPVMVDPCPDCGAVHLVPRCGGKQGRPRLVQLPAPNRRWSAVSRVPVEWAEERRALGVSWRTVIALGLAVVRLRRRRKRREGIAWIVRCR